MSQPQAAFHIGSRFQEVFSTVFHSMPKILVFLLIFVIGWFVATASIVMVALGVIAALNQLGTGAAVTRPVLYTVLLTCGAIIAIGVGGGLIKPMQARWERMLAAAERETSGQPDKHRVGQGPGPGYSPGPRYLQGTGLPRGPGYTQSFGYHIGGQGFPCDSGRKEDPVQFPADIPDDPDNYPGGQYM